MPARTLSKFMLLVASVATLFAAAAPSASANWIETKTQEELPVGENPVIQATGSFAITSSYWGSVTCPNATITLRLTGGTTIGHLENFGLEDATQCVVSGGLYWVTGGSNTFKRFKVKGPTEVEASGSFLPLSASYMEVEFTNGFLFLLTTGGSLGVAFDSGKTIGALGWSWGLHSNWDASAWTVEGSLPVLAPNKGTFGTAKH